MNEQPAAAPPAPEKKHETSDANPRTVVLVMLGLAVFAVIAQFVIAGVAGYFQAEGRERASGGNPLGIRRNDQPLNRRLQEVRQPRLEGLRELEGQPPFMRSSLPAPEGNSPEFHSDNLRPEAQPRLQHYGWVDKSKGVIHIPIDQAMNAAQQMNLFPTQAGAKEQSNSSSAPGRARESNSGQGNGGATK